MTSVCVRVCRAQEARHQFKTHLLAGGALVEIQIPAALTG
jgi:hypothetical protein